MVKQAEIYAAAPGTTRGRATMLGGHADTERICYTVGKTVVIRSLKNTLEAETYSDHQTAATCARFSPNGSWIASGDASGRVRVWGAANKDLKVEVPAISGSVDDIAWSDDSQRIVAGGDGRGKLVKAFIWDTGSDLGDFAGLSKRVNSVAFRPTRPYRIMTGSEDFAVNLYEGPPFKFVKKVAAHGNFVNCVRYSPDGGAVASASSDSKVFLYNGETGEKTCEMAGHAGTVYCLSWSADGKKLLTASADKTARIWDVATQKVVTTFAFGKDTDAMQVGCLWLGQHILSLSLNGDISLMSEASPEKPSHVISGHRVNVTALAAAPGGGAAVSGSYDGELLQWRIGAGCAGRAAVRKGALLSVAAAPSTGEIVSIGSDDQAVWAKIPITDAPTASHKLPGAPCGISAACSGSGAFVCATNKGIVLLAKGAAVATMPLPAGGASLTAVAVAPGGAECAVGFDDNSIRIYRVTAAALQDDCALEARHRGAVTCLAYSPDGSMLASGDANREVIVWDASARTAKITRMVYHTARVTCLAWDAASKMLASGSLDSSIILWDTAGEPVNRVAMPLAHKEGVAALAFVGPASLLSAGADACLRRWQLDE